MLWQEWRQSGVTYNPLSSRVYLNPYPKYAELRRKAPIHWSPLMDAWVVTRYTHVDTILRDHKRFSNDPRQRRRTRVPRTTAMVEQGGGLSMLFVDPPEHTRLRSLVNKAFTPQAIAALMPRITAIVNELLDQIPDPSRFDLIETLAYPLPVMVMAELLGIPAQDRAQFKRWSERRARVIEPTITTREIRAANEAMHETEAYFRTIIAARRQEPRDDLISTLLAEEESGEQLSEDELLVMLRLLLIAGNETTTNLIGNGLLALLRHPEQWQMLRANPSLIDSAVEECLRYDTPVQVDFRVALEETEIGQQRLRRGQGMMLLLGAANRDPEMFSDAERFDITRRDANHLAFGRGVHHCLGAQLARVEGRLAFTGLLARFRDLRLLTPTPPYKNNVVLRGLRALPLGATLARA
jgi:cytochrome P450